MKRNSTPSTFGIEDPLLSATHRDSKCSTCGEEFKAPLFAMFFFDSEVEDYYACPRCLSKVSSLETSKPIEVDEDQEEKFEAPIEIKFESAVRGTNDCTHHLGYLKKRQKDKPIPEECLTCSKMIECIY